MVNVRTGSKTSRQCTEDRADDILQSPFLPVCCDRVAVVAISLVPFFSSLRLVELELSEVLFGPL